MATIRQKLHSYLEVTDDKKVKAIYAIMEKDIEGSGVIYADEFKKELDRRYADYKNGKVKMITAEESTKRIEQILKAARKRRKK